MRTFLASVAMLAALAVSAGRAAQDVERSPQRFQSGIDLVTIDVAALDGEGRPVEDLQARDFTVRVDGRTREVVLAELVSVDRGQAAPPPAAAIDALVTTNAAVANGRRIVIGVDQTLILPGAITHLLRTASAFVDGLMPQDHAAFVAFPEPGPRVDFTTDKVLVREAMQALVGQPAKGGIKQFDISLTESFDVNNKERIFIDLGSNNPERVWRSLGPTIRRVLERGCEGLTLEELRLLDNIEVLRNCVRNIVSESMLNVLEGRTDADISLRALEAFLADLVAVDGSKSLVIFSAGLLTEDLSALDEVTRLAAAARTSITVIAVEPQRERETITDFSGGQSSTALQDRSLELQGLETIADRTGGRFVRSIAGNGQGIFDRLETELSAWYVVAVERQPGDPDRQRVEVDVRRRGVTVRSSRTFVATAAINAARPREELLNEALSSPIAIAGVPLRVSTFAQRDTASGKYRLHVAAQIGRPGTPAGEFAVGYLVLNDDRRVVASLGRRLTLSAAGGSEESDSPDAVGTSAPLHFDTALLIDPGAYAIRFGVVDADGRRGTVVHRVELEPPAADALETSDLIVGTVPPDGDVMHPSVEPHVAGGRVAGYLELYLPEAEPGGLTVTLEIAEGEASPALTTQRLNLGAGAQPAWRVASGAVEASLLPGRYLARATIRRGGETVRVLSRPFVLERSESPRPRPEARERAVAISPELQRRTAAYVGTVVGSLSNIVGQEEFVLTAPDRRVTSDFLLVRYPGSIRDLLTFRDVREVDGVAVPNPEERLADLFLKPIGSIRDQVRQIALAAEQQVPPVLNPIFGLAFLQADFQPRFELTVSDAGADWPPGVKAVSFVETARPTLLRAGPLGDLDVPTRGKAWIEEGTGRILQTELRVEAGRSPPTIVTRFTLDPRLQIMVPQVMTTQNPSGVATYSNFRQFSVYTEAELPN